jgi:hypothetical protein
MLAFRMKIADAYRGVTVQIYLIVEFTNVQVIQRAKVEEPVGVHYTINDIRRLSGIDEIYGIYDAKEWNVYYGLITQHVNELHATEETLKNDPVIQKDIAEHRKDMKEFAMWKAARKWEV